MNDFLTGTNTEYDACKIRSEVIVALCRAAFVLLLKWVSNHASLLDHFSNKMEYYVFCIDKNKTIKTLDIFSKLEIYFNSQFSRLTTRRETKYTVSLGIS